jgi:hypothetical protein
VLPVWFSTPITPITRPQCQPVDVNVNNGLQVVY